MKTKAILTAAVIGIVAFGATAAFAQRDPAYAAARSAGQVGEQPDGYLGIVGAATPALRRADSGTAPTVPTAHVSRGAPCSQRRAKCSSSSACTSPMTNPSTAPTVMRIHSSWAKAGRIRSSNSRSVRFCIFDMRMWRTSMESRA